MKRIRPLAVVVLFAVAACEPSRDPVAAPGARPEGAPPEVMIAAALPDPPASPPAEPPVPEPPPAAVGAHLVPAAPAGSTGWRAMFRDARRVRLSPRSHALVITEIQGLETLFASTPKSSPDRPKLMRRLADTYVELEAGALQAAPPAAKLAKVAAASRSAATKYYQIVSSQYPRFCAVPGGSQGSGCADEALYYGGYEMELAGDLDGARKSYLALLQGFPQSRLTPLAYLAFGEMFFEEARGDPSKLPLAEQSYQEVLKYPPGPNDVQGYAQYQLGRVLALHGDRTRALSTLRLALLWARNHQGVPGAVELADAVQREQP
jgi:hypothetical protein